MSVDSLRKRGDVRLLECCFCNVYEIIAASCFFECVVATRVWDSVQFVVALKLFKIVNILLVKG